MAAAITQSDFVKSKKSMPYAPAAGLAVVVRATHAFAVAELEAGDIIEFLAIPPGMRVVDMVLDSDDLDSGTPAVTLDVGIMSGEYGDTDQARTVGAEFFAASTVAQAGGVVRPTLKTAFRTSISQVARSIGVKVVAAPGTAATGTVGLTVTFATD